MAWTGQSFSVGQVLTAAQMNNLQADITALANGDAGAPDIVEAALAAVVSAQLVTNGDSHNHSGGDGASIPYSGMSFSNNIVASDLAANAVGQSEIGANAVGQSEIKDTSGIVSNTGNTFVRFTLPGGAYGFYPRVKASIASSTQEPLVRISAPSGSSPSTSYTTIISLSNEEVTATTYAQQYYFQASPPYDLGDGEIGRFIFAIVDNATGEIKSVYSAPEAPWHYNGPTDIRGKLAKDGKKYSARKDMSGYSLSLTQAKLNIGTLQAYNLAFQNAPMIQEEITQDIKQADMNLIPHPFMGNDLTGKTIVMLDPVSDLNHELDELSQYEDFDINELLHDGYLEISNIGLNRSGPPGILIPSFKWKNTL